MARALAGAILSTTTVTTTSNAYCAALCISPPRIEGARSSPDANFYSLLIVALLEHGEPMTLAEVAARFAAAGITSTADEALASLKRCKPARAPVYRDGETYALDPHDDEVDFWLFRLGLRPARSAPLRAAPNASAPLPSADKPLTVAALDEAWREGAPSAWSAQRVAVAVLDAHQLPMSSDDVIAFVSARSRWSPLRPESAQFWMRGIHRPCWQTSMATRFPGLTCSWRDCWTGREETNESAAAFWPWRHPASGVDRSQRGRSSARRHERAGERPSVSSLTSSMTA